MRGGGGEGGEAKACDGDEEGEHANGGLHLW
jgi:hypothetical protein